MKNKKIKEELKLLLNTKTQMPKMYSFDEVRELVKFVRRQTVEGIKKILEGKGFIGYKDLEEMYE